MKRLVFPTLGLVIIGLFVACNQSVPIESTYTWTLDQSPIGLSATSTPESTSKEQPVLITTPTYPPTSSATMEVPRINTPRPSPTTIPTLTAGQPITITNLRMINATTGWAIEAAGHIVRTTDGGDTWGNVTPPQGSYTEGGFFALDADTAWATPRQGGCGWAVCSSPSDMPILTSADVWHTTNGGQAWETSQPLRLDVYSDMGQDSVPYYEPIDMQFINTQTGWLLVRVDHIMNRDHLAFFKTEDGGENWERLVDEQHQYTSTLPCIAYGLAFVDAQTGWMGGNCLDLGMEEKWNTNRTIDGGHTWNSFALPAPNDLPAEFAQNDYQCGTGFVTRFPAGPLGMQMFCRVFDGSAIGYHVSGYYFLSADGGQTWQTWQPATTPEFVNAKLGWRLVTLGEGRPNQLQQTRDGGITWTAILSVSWQGAQIDFVSEQVGWAIVTNGDVTALLHTTDGGNTWVGHNQITIKDR